MERSPTTILLLSLVTCGVYGLIWKYQTTDELRRATGDESIKPTLDLILALVTCGIWGIYTNHRNAQRVFQMSRQLGLMRSDQSTSVLVLSIFGLGIVNLFILQGEYNALGQHARMRALPY